MRLSRRVWLAIGAVSVMWGAILTVTLPRYWRLHKISQAAGITVGTVVDVDRSNHDIAQYEYAVDGVRYQGSIIAAHENKGDGVHVYYALSDPSLATTREPGAAARDTIMGTLWLLGFVAIGLPLVGAVRGPGGWLGLILLLFAAVEVTNTPTAAAPLAVILVVGVLGAVWLRWLYARRANGKLLNL